MLLVEIRAKTISVASALRKKENSEMVKLESEIKVLEMQDPDKNFDSINLKKEDLKNIREKRLNGILVRSRARWIEHGEKPSKFFCSLENRNFVSKRMTSLYNSKNEETQNPTEITNEVFNFYKHLYDSKESEITSVELETLLNEGTPKLSENAALQLEGYNNPRSGCGFEKHG